ncbi:prepilin peptidase, partial [Streptomyces sp. NPDC048551]
MGHAVIVLLAVAYGAAAGLLGLPRAAYRLSVDAGEPWRERCPEGHPIAGWLGPARCRGRRYGPAGAWAASVVADTARAGFGAATGTTVP